MTHNNLDIWNVIETVLDEHFPESDKPGCAVMAVQNDKSRYYFRGLANLESGVPVGPKTNFRLASVAKQFTAACILQLRDAGKLALAQRLTEFFPDFPRYGADITVENLLRHTSGVKDYEKLVAEDYEGPPVMDAQVLELLAGEEAGDFEPGSMFRYSNSGYALLAMIVEKVSGLGFPKYLKANIFDPLGMTGTLALVNRPGSPEVPERAIGYKLDGEGNFGWADQGSTSAVLGDGGIYCSVSDYEKWIRAYWSGELLSQATVAEAWQPGATTGGEVVPYGYGWRLAELDGKWRPYHPGSTTGFRNGSIVNYENRTAVLVLTNRCNGDAVALATQIEQLLLGFID